jgi:hypothetical protein
MKIFTVRMELIVLRRPPTVNFAEFSVERVVTRYTAPVQPLRCVPCFTASYVESPGGEEKCIRAKVLRILKKQAGGSWKGAVGMWNMAE